MRVLILGGNGMLGHKLCELFKDRFETWATTRSGYSQYARYGFFKPERTIGGVNVSDFDTVVRAVATAHPEVVINAIGIIKQLPSARDPIASLTVNSLFPHRLATLCQAANARLIQFSTDCVFSGRKGMYTEDDQPDPDDLYGRSKLLGEVAGPNAVTLRTSIIGRELQSANSLVEWFLANSGQRVRGYTKAIYSGFPTVVLAEIIGSLIEQQPDLSGLYHVSSVPISKYDLLCLVRDAYRLPVEIEPFPDLHVDRSLDSSRFRAATGFSPPPWPQMVQAMADDPTPYEVWRRAGAS